jgi:hypothetical protein
MNQMRGPPRGACAPHSSFGSSLSDLSCRC